MAAIGAAWIAVWSYGRSPEAGSGTFDIMMTDYAFEPSEMTWFVGQRVTLSMTNRSEATPPKAHEIMFGREPRTAPDAFGAPIPSGGFVEPLLSGVTIDLQGGGNLSMLTAPGSTFVGQDPMSLVAPDPGMAMEQMDQFMSVLKPAGELTMSFVVPDRPGAWQFGCFQQDGQHYLNGMRGTILIKEP